MTGRVDYGITVRQGHFNPANNITTYQWGNLQTTTLWNYTTDIIVTFGIINYSDALLLTFGNGFRHSAHRLEYVWWRRGEVGSIRQKDWFHATINVKA